MKTIFALRAALDDAGKKGIKLIALPGDFTLMTANLFTYVG